MNISIDSNSLTYLIQASEPEYEPSEDEESNYIQKVSMLRIFLYGGLTCGILPQVYQETNDISDRNLKDIHESTLGVLFHNIHPTCTDVELINRVDELLEKHPKIKDCQLLAEAEFSGIDVLLTRDHRFRNRLNDVSEVELVFPSDFVKRMDFKKGDTPKFYPLESNPLYRKEWWKL